MDVTAVGIPGQNTTAGPQKNKTFNPFTKTNKKIKSFGNQSFCW